MEGVTQMTSNNENILVMAIFMVTKEDVQACARELKVPPERITDEVIEQVKEKVGLELRNWRGVIKGIVKETIGCPIGLVCSNKCAWREVGGCLPLKAK